MLKLPAVKSKNLIKALKIFGFFGTQTKRHRSLGYETQRRQTNNYSNALKQRNPKGTLMVILKDIQITKEELLNIM